MSALLEVRGRRAWRWLAALWLLLAPATARPAEILRCLGPSDAVLFTDTVCPAGFTLAGRLPARVTPAALPCTEADSLGPAEIDAALLDATARLRELRGPAGNGEARAAWERCLSVLAARKVALQGAEASSGPEPAGQRPRGERVEEICRVGSFETRPQPGGFDVLYTNRSPRACRSVPYSCLWGVFSSVGFYQQSTRAVYRGRIGPGETTVIATVEAQGGPADREVVWSWCAIR